MKQIYSIDELIEKLDKHEIDLYTDQQVGPYNHQRTVIIYDSPLSIEIHTNKKLLYQNKEKYYDPGFKRQHSIFDIITNRYTGFVATLKAKRPTNVGREHPNLLYFLKNAEAKRLFNHLEDLFKEVEKRRFWPKEN